MGKSGEWVNKGAGATVASTHPEQRLAGLAAFGVCGLLLASSAAGLHAGV